MEKKLTRKQALRRRRIFIAICCVVLAIAIAAIAGVISLISDAVQKNPGSGSKSDTPTSSTEPEEVKKIATATVVNTGDVIIHNPILQGAYVASGDRYDFSSLFPKAAPYFKKADLAVANLEVTLGGTAAGKYSGYPAFNTPDSLIDSIKNAGIGVLLTANNHCYDTGLSGVKRTVQVLKEKEIPFVGTRETDTDPNYLIQSVNGIKIGMACFTYETSSSSTDRKSINGATINAQANNLINSFSYDHIDDFYRQAETMIADMKKDGADCTVFYMHWGVEYRLKPNTWQETLAQKLCDLGVDVIVGGHPHVIEPMALLHASGSDHTAVCIYSMGNAISNQRVEEVSNLCATGHTEDGMLFYYTFDKYSDGTTVLSGVDIIPTWVDKVGARYNAKYTMYPMESADDPAQKYGLSNATALRAKSSFERTKALVGASLSECQQFLGCKVRFE